MSFEFWAERDWIDWQTPTTYTHPHPYTQKYFYFSFIFIFVSSFLFCLWSLHLFELLLLIDEKILTSFCIHSGIGLTGPTHYTHPPPHTHKKIIFFNFFFIFFLPFLYVTFNACFDYYRWRMRNILTAFYVHIPSFICAMFKFVLRWFYTLILIVYDDGLYFLICLSNFLYISTCTFIPQPFYTLFPYDFVIPKGG